MGDKSDRLNEQFPRDPSAPMLYTNQVRIRTRVFDTVISFYVEEIDGTKRHVADVHMSPAHAKSLWYLLGRQVSHYEKSTQSSLPDPEATAQADDKSEAK